MKIANTKDAQVLIVDYNAICTLRSAIAWSGQEQFFCCIEFQMKWLQTFICDLISLIIAANVRYGCLIAANPEVAVEQAQVLR